jgi:adenine/guanine phosphoribosyltransferase-like PRPP-binding protein
MVRSGYLHEVFDPHELRKVIDRIKKRLEDEKLSYDAIAFRGTSGAAVAFPLSAELGKPLIHVRKSLGHSKLKVEGYYGAKTYIIVDDFVESGKTLRVIKNSIIRAYRGAMVHIPVCVGIILYVPADPGWGGGFIEKNFKKAQFFCVGGVLDP